MDIDRNFILLGGVKMAWNPSPQVAVARAAASKLGAEQVVIVFIKPNGQYGMASYGATKELCAEAGRLGDKLFETTGAYFEVEA